MSESAARGEQRRIEELIAALEAVKDPQARDCASELVQGILELHGAGVARLLAIVGDAGEAGRTIIDGFARDESVRAILLLHGLHPQDVAERVRQAVNGMRALLGAQGVVVELTSIGEDAVRLKLSGSWHGKKLSVPQLRREIEDTIFELAPEVAAIEIEGLPDPNVHEIKFVPAATLRGNGAGAGP